MFDKLDKVHSIQLEMALEVKRICEKYNIKYSIIAGTLLGAIRHKGFIPWDDDLDIGMLRSEYQKFIEISKKELSNKYFLQTWQTDPGFALPIAKIRKNGTKFVEQGSSASDLHCGIYIDIFPFDNVPHKKIFQVMQNVMTYIFKRIILVRLKYKLWQDNEILKKFTYYFINFISKLFSVNQIKEFLFKIMTLYNKKETEKVVAFGGAYGYKKESINREWLIEQNDIQFENGRLSAPINFSDYLTYFYGDYMTPPPENKRYNRHKIIDISFEGEN